MSNWHLSWLEMECLADILPSTSARVPLRWLEFLAMQAHWRTEWPIDWFIYGAHLPPVSVLSSCTGSQEPIQKSKQCSTTKQRFVKKGVQWLFPLCTGTPGHNPCFSKNTLMFSYSRGVPMNLHSNFRPCAFRWKGGNAVIRTKITLLVRFDMHGHRNGFSVTSDGITRKYSLYKPIMRRMLEF